MAQTFDEYKKEISESLPQGYVLDENKLEELKKAFEKGEKINAQEFAIEEKSTPKRTVINEESLPEEPREEAQDSSWKEKYAKEWQLWGEHNRLEFKDASIPARGDALSFRFYEGKSNDFAAEITYETPYNINLRGSDGKIPDSKYFEKAVSMAIENGTAIEFGNISSPEFKAKLLAACYKQGNAQIVNGPTEEEISKWPDNLKKLIAQSRPKPQPKQEQKQEQAPQQPQEKTPIQKIAELRARIQARDEKIKKAQEEAKASGKTFSEAEKETLYQEDMSAEEKLLRNLRKQSKSGDSKATQELYARREKTLTDDFKYNRVIMKNENDEPIYKDGKPEYIKDEKGNYIYEQDENTGENIKSEAYKAFLARKNNKSRK